MPFSYELDSVRSSLNCFSQKCCKYEMPVCSDSSWHAEHSSTKQNSDLMEFFRGEAAEGLRVNMCYFVISYFLKDLSILFYVHRCFCLHIWMSISFVLNASMTRRGALSPWNWRYRCLWGIMLMLGTEPQSPARGTQTLNYRSIPLSPLNLGFMA